MVKSEKRDNVVLFAVKWPEASSANPPEMPFCLADARTARPVRGDPTTRVAVVTGTGGNVLRLGAAFRRLIALMSRLWPPQEGRPRDSRAVTFSAPDAVNPGVAALDGYAVTRRVELSRRTNLRIVWQTADLGVRALKARRSNCLRSHPDPTNIARLQGKGVTHD